MGTKIVLLFLVCYNNIVLLLYVPVCCYSITKFLLLLLLLLFLLLQFVTEEIDNYRLYTLVPQLLSFLELLTNWWVIKP